MRGMMPMRWWAGLALAAALACGAPVDVALAADACRSPSEATHAALAAVRALRCSRGRAAAGDGCAVAAAPACARDAIVDAVDLVRGGSDGGSSSNGRCEESVRRGAERFLWIALHHTAQGELHRAVLRRARRALAPIERACRSRAPAPRIGAACASYVTAAARGAIDAPGLRGCLDDALTRAVGRIDRQWIKPDIVLILTDDQRWDTLQYMPRVMDDLASHGVTFTSAYATTALCAPSRSSVLTGRYAGHTGVLTNGGVFNSEGGMFRFDDRATIATALKARGYRTAMIGKYINSYNGWAPYQPPGWSEWRAFELESFYDYSLVVNGKYEPHGHAPADYSTDVLVKHAVSVIESAGDEPLFVLFAPFAPHAPAPPAPRHAGRFKDLRPWRPPSYDEEDVSDKPPFFAQRFLRFTPERKRQVDQMRADMIGSLLAVDEGVGAIMDALRKTGRDRDALVVFTSDNGHGWGEHRWDTKQCPYEECRHIPMIVRYPPLVTAPRTDDHFALNVDLAPTFAALGGAALPEPDGTSLLPLLEYPDAPWRTDVLGEHWGIMMPPTFALVQDRRWKYVEYFTGEKELYDLVADPNELRSVAADPANAERVASMAGRLRELRPDWPPKTMFPPRPRTPAVPFPPGVQSPTPQRRPAPVPPPLGNH
jgi:N-acetylglucosamine-6-sulfatase